MNNNKDENFLENIQTVLDERVDNLDAATASNLRKARNRALEQIDRKPLSSWKKWSLPLAGMAAASIVIMLAILIHKQPVEIATSIGIEDVEILVSNESPDFYADLDFYIWLTEEDDFAG